MTQVEQFAFPFVLKRSAKRKTISVTVYPDQTVVLSAPTRMSDQLVYRFLKDRSAWVEAKLKRFAQIGPIQTRHRYHDDEIFHLRGQSLKLRVRVASRKQVFVVGDELMVEAPDHASIRDALADFYRKQAKQYFEVRTRYFAALMNVQPTHVSVRDYRSRWGSCKSTGEIVFNWRLMMTYDFISDYVIAHELSHLKHFNHSKSFWNCVAAIFPDYKNARQQLKLMGLRGELEL